MYQNTPSLADLITQQLIIMIPVQLVYAFLLYLYAKREGRWGVQIVLALIPFVGLFWFGIYMIRMQLRVLNRLNALEAQINGGGSMGVPDAASIQRLNMGPVPR